MTASTADMVARARRRREAERREARIDKAVADDLVATLATELAAFAAELRQESAATSTRSRGTR